MSWADDASPKERASTGDYSLYYFPEIEEDIDNQFEVTIVLGNGIEICKNCGSKNIKVSTKGNKYCADLCWVDKNQQKGVDDD